MYLQRRMEGQGILEAERAAGLPPGWGLDFELSPRGQRALDRLLSVRETEFRLKLATYENKFLEELIHLASRPVAVNLTARLEEIKSTGIVDEMRQKQILSSTLRAEAERQRQKLMMIRLLLNHAAKLRGRRGRPRLRDADAEEVWDGEDGEWGLSSAIG